MCVYSCVCNYLWAKCNPPILYMDRSKDVNQDLIIFMFTVMMSKYFEQGIWHMLYIRQTDLNTQISPEDFSGVVLFIYIKPFVC